MVLYVIPSMLSFKEFDYRISRDNGKENGNYYEGFKVWGLGCRVILGDRDMIPND